MSMHDSRVSIYACSMSFHDNDSMFKTLSHFPIYVSSYKRGSICAATYQLHDMLAMFLKLSS